MENRRSRKGLTKHYTHIGRLKTGQLLTSIPRWIVEKKDINSSLLFKWSDGGLNRIIIEVVNKEGV